ncbi:glycosyltransferase family 2 protein [Halomonas sp. DN3]|uniref:glycosyltransferase family 2 protein n=1 Tax=Halomonas sp. DN3 TaxID=2953657 RepID=UPI0020A195A8|nr:glycosyltransferase family 2 protein [Halomonas sp. DN3]USZ49662.1 glycosyltransferase family 2 protein [Halomonas sp. DN3]
MAKFCVAGIVRNEVDYLVEWIAWHKLAGFDHAILADNGSDDGTRPLLEALESLGVVSLVYQPVMERHAQQLAYRRILAKALGEHDYVMFLDADEFLVHESQVHGEECRELEKLVERDGVDGVSINWRCFGSAGKKKYERSPVLKRFNYCAKPPGCVADHHVKSLMRVERVKIPYCHSSTLTYRSQYVDSAGKVIEDFVGSRDKTGNSDPRGGRTASIHEGPLRVHHYAVKSREEFERKRFRGSATKGTSYDKGEGYFRRYNVNEDKFYFQPGKLVRLEREISLLKQLLKNKTTLTDRLLGAVDFSGADELTGWVTARDGSSVSQMVNIFVNGVHVGRTRAGFYRPDLVRAGKAKDGFCGFRWAHPLPLSAGDRVTVSLHANESPLAGRSEFVVGDP